MLIFALDKLLSYIPPADSKSNGGVWLSLTRGQPSLFFWRNMKKKQFGDIVSFTSGRISNQLRAKTSRNSQFYNYKSKELLIELMIDSQVYAFLGIQANILMLLQSIYAFRIGELLRLTRDNVHSNGFVYVPGSKRSNGKIIHFPDLKEMEFVRDLPPSAKIFTITYRQYYSLLNRLGLSRKMNSYSKHYSVTHLFRHLRLQANERLASGDYDTQKNFSGHKSNSGISNYLINSKLSRDGRLEQTTSHK